MTEGYRGGLLADVELAGFGGEVTTLERRQQQSSADGETDDLAGHVDHRPPAQPVDVEASGDGEIPYPSE